MLVTNNEKSRQYNDSDTNTSNQSSLFSPQHNDFINITVAYMDLAEYKDTVFGIK